MDGPAEAARVPDREKAIEILWRMYQNAGAVDTETKKMKLSAKTLRYMGFGYSTAWHDQQKQ